MMDPAVSRGRVSRRAQRLSHALGLALWLTGLRGSSVYALMLRPKDSPVEYYDALAIRYNDGAIGAVSGILKPSRGERKQARPSSAHHGKRR